ncbi:MAG: AAA family ATPase [Candidatus Eisenbacteria bacterium]|nr:AAA family ATPase [Candidatus Eisenbacteria bacterium]
MGRVIAVANQKGGVGKTTTAVNLSAALAASDRKILLIDLDPQGNASSGLGVRVEPQDTTTYEVLIGSGDAEQAIRSTVVEGLDLLPGDARLAGAEIELVDLPDREIILRQRIAPLRDRYRYVFLDCPPSLGFLTLNALTAVESVLVPIQCEYCALEGLGRLMETLDRVRESLNPTLRIEGILLTMYDGRLNLSLQVAEEARHYFGDQVYRTMIPRNVRLGEAPSFGSPITLYDPHCVGAASYVGLAKEILENDQEGAR